MSQQNREQPWGRALNTMKSNARCFGAWSADCTSSTSWGSGCSQVQGMDKLDGKGRKTLL